MPPFPTKEEGPTETTLRVASPVLDKSEPAEKKVDSPAGQSEKRAQADSPVPGLYSLPQHGSLQALVATKMSHMSISK